MTDKTQEHPEDDAGQGLHWWPVDTFENGVLVERRWERRIDLPEPQGDIVDILIDDDGTIHSEDA